MDQSPPVLAPPAVASLRAQQTTVMERSISQDIRTEREDLREAAEQTLNAIVDLNMDGTIRWVSPSWNDVVGTPYDSVNGKPISHLIVSDNKTVFNEVIDAMKSDDSKSYRVSFTVQLGPLSKLREAIGIGTLKDLSLPQTAELEAQGIMVYDTASGGESHTMWMLRPWSGPHEFKIDLPDVIVDSLGSGAELLAGYLTKLAESVGDDAETRELRPPVLCRICERQLSPWWFEKHTDLCLQEHRAEMDVQMAQENLTEHRHAIVRVLDDLEARRSRAMIGEPQLVHLTEYKGIPIGPPPSTQSSPGTSLASSRDRSGGFGHARNRSFAIRRPQARIVELLMDLCDTAIEISSPAIKDNAARHDDGTPRTQSPLSEARIAQVLQWQSPSTNTVEQEQGLALLCADTEKVAKAKVDAVFRHQRTIEYAERIRVELALMVQDCIDSAMRKAARLAAGRLSDSSEDERDDREEEAQMDPEEDQQRVAREALAEGDEEQITRADVDVEPGPTPSALAVALRQMDLSSVPSRPPSRPSSFVTTRSSSPRDCPTPRSLGEGSRAMQSSQGARRKSSLNDAEASEGQAGLRSSSLAPRNTARPESPASDKGNFRRASSAKRHQRRSLAIPSAPSSCRQDSPSRCGQPPSPLRIRPRVHPGPPDGLTSPEASPMLHSSEFSSPVAAYPTRHHQRQSSAAISDFMMRAPPSPRLTTGQPPPLPRPAQPSIKDFEIIKPISKGAFGSVYLSKKKSTGEYFAIKVLKKADMVAKNQVGNVKAERAIMMWQGQSDFVAKLYWTFSSKDYLYLVMEYLNGGDCASLIKVLGGLPEDWVTKYLAEVVLGVEHLHKRDIIHRDLKPDNLLIDQRGHLKLTDFGLSRMGLIGRQKRALDNEAADATPDLLKQGPFARSTSMASSRSTSLDLHGHAPAHSPGSTPQITPEAANPAQPSYFNLSAIHQEPRRISSSQRSDSAGSEAMQLIAASPSNEAVACPRLPTAKSALHEEPLMNTSPDLQPTSVSARASVDGHLQSSLPASNMMPPPMALFDPEDTNRRFVGTPDYLAPETINGDKQDETSDWWSVGCILFEFLYGVPPFHASEAEQVFENILARRIQWPDDPACEPVSDQAKDLINKLLCMDPQARLGANREGKFTSGGHEIRSHPWFQGINWGTLLEDEAQFVPHPENPEDTEYFDARGAVLQSFAEEIEDQMSPQSSVAGSELQDRPHDALARVPSHANAFGRKLMPLHIPPHVMDLKSRRLSEPVFADDFGAFTFKNLPALEKANKEVMQKLRAGALAAHSKQSSSVGGVGSVVSPGPSLDSSPIPSSHAHRSVSNAKAGNRTQSPSGFSHSNSSPSRASQPSSPLLVSFVAGQGTEGRRKASSNSSSLSHQSTSLQPPAAFDVPKVPPSLQKAATTLAASPVKIRAVAPLPLSLSPSKMTVTSRQGSNSSASRSRSLTVGSQDASPSASEVMQHHRNRRSQVFDMSPSSSDNEGDRHNALLRVQRRRQSSLRMSQIAFDGKPSFRPLDVLICEDHPVSRMVMEKLLEKLRCRTISVANGSEAVRYSMSEIQFDVIFLEYRLPRISGADVARMIRETRNPNCHTPIVAITAYLKELQAPHYFDSLIEKPISSSKLAEVLRSLCQWRPISPNRAAPGPTAQPFPIAMRKAPPARADDSPISSVSAFAGRHMSALASSREDSLASSLFGDTDSVTTDDLPMNLSRKTTNEAEDKGLGITEAVVSMEPELSPRGIPSLLAIQSAPGQMEHPLPANTKCALQEELVTETSEKTSDEADIQRDGSDLLREPHPRWNGKPIFSKTMLPSSKLGIEMMRANSHESTMACSESTPEAVTQVATTPSEELRVPPFAMRTPSKEKLSALGTGPAAIMDNASSNVDATPRPTLTTRPVGFVAESGRNEPPPRGNTK